MPCAGAFLSPKRGRKQRFDRCKMLWSGSKMAATPAGDILPVTDVLFENRY